MLVYVNLPLFRDASYTYNIALEGITYKFKFYYNERDERWLFDMLYADNTPIVMGEGLVSNYPILLDYDLPDLSGFLLLSPIVEDKNQTTNNPFELSQYYRLRYYYEREG